MMLKVKETDMEFWKKLQPEARPDGKTFAFTLSAVSILIQVKHHLRLLSFLKQSFGSLSFFLFLGQRGVCIKQNMNLILVFYTHVRSGM